MVQRIIKTKKTVLEPNDEIRKKKKKKKLKSEHKEMIYDRIETNCTDHSSFDTMKRARKRVRREKESTKLERIESLTLWENALCIYGRYNTTTIYKIRRYSNYTQE